MSEEPQYLLPEPGKEIARLTEQDAVVTHMMNNKRILAPIDLAKPGLQILDSGTADGLFLRRIQPLLTEPYTLLGYDVMKSFFPPAAPPHTTFAIHDISEPWPAELRDTCDLVHQRLTIPGGAKKATPREIVRYLCELVKPGGWIQLVEMDITGTVHGAAMRDAWAATAAFLTAAGEGTDYAKSMAGWLREEGFEDVQDVHVELEFGARADDAEWGARGAKVMVEAFVGVVGACKMMNVEVPLVNLEGLPERAQEEMMTQGGGYPLVFAFGRKPAT
ncbi:methyltransferase SirN-like protein [Whalleya microplaca]|nr:methyltransferase SirN-like protein [Whalleya microplaca]